MATPGSRPPSALPLEQISRGLRRYYDRVYYGFEGFNKGPDAAWLDIQRRVKDATGESVSTDTIERLMDGTGRRASLSPFGLPAAELDALARYLSKVERWGNPEIPQPPYAEDQLDRVRVAVRLYKHRTGRTWKDVVCEILARAGPESEYVRGDDDERSLKDYENVLLRFCVGFPKGKFSRVQDQGFMTLILRFVLSDYPGLLKPLDLATEKQDFQAALRLQEHLYAEMDTAFVPPTDALAGSYKRLDIRNGALVSHTLSIAVPDESGLLRVHERDETYDRSIIHTYPSLGEQERQAQASLRVFAGWAILTPEDNLIFLLKRRGTGENRIYCTLAVGQEGEFTTPVPDREAWLTAIEDITLVHHDYPLVLGKAETAHSLPAIMSLAPFGQRSDQIGTEVLQHLRGAMIIMTNAHLFLESKACQTLLERHAQLFRSDAAQDTSLAFRIHQMITRQEINVERSYASYKSRTARNNLLVH